MPEATKAKGAAESSVSVASSESAGAAFGAEACLGLVENRLRNLTKRKARLEEKQKAARKGTAMGADELAALEKMGEVDLLMGSLTELKEQVKGAVADAAKRDKAQTRAREAERKVGEATRIQEILHLQRILGLFQAHKAAALAQLQLSASEKAAVDAALERLLVAKPGSPLQDGRLAAVAADAQLLLSQSPKPFLNSLSFKALHAVLFTKLANCAVILDAAQGKAASKATDKTAEVAETAAEAKEEEKKKEGSKGKRGGKGRGRKEEAKEGQSQPKEEKAEEKKEEAPKQQRPPRNRPAKPEAKKESQAAAEEAASAEVQQPAMAEAPMPVVEQQLNGGPLVFHNRRLEEGGESPSAVLPESDIQFLQPEEGMVPLGMEQMMLGGVPAPFHPQQLLHAMPPNVYAANYGSVYRNDVAAHIHCAQGPPEARGPPSPIPMPTHIPHNHAQPAPPPFANSGAGWRWAPPPVGVEWRGLRWVPPPTPLFRPMPHPTSLAPTATLNSSTEWPRLASPDSAAPGDAATSAPAPRPARSPADRPAPTAAPSSPEPTPTPASTGPRTTTSPPSPPTPPPSRDPTDASSKDAPRHPPPSDLLLPSPFPAISHSHSISHSISHSHHPLSPDSPAFSPSSRKCQLFQLNPHSSAFVPSPERALYAPHENALVLLQPLRNVPRPPQDIAC